MTSKKTTFCCQGNRRRIEFKSRLKCQRLSPEAGEFWTSLLTDWEIFSHRWIWGGKISWGNRLLLKIFLIKMQKTSKKTLEVSMICVTFGEAHDIFKDVIIWRIRFVWRYHPHIFHKAKHLTVKRGPKPARNLQSPASPAAWSCDRPLQASHLPPFQVLVLADVFLRKRIIRTQSPRSLVKHLNTQFFGNTRIWLEFIPLMFSSSLPCTCFKHGIFSGLTPLV